MNAGSRHQWRGKVNEHRTGNHCNVKHSLTANRNYQLSVSDEASIR